jgi:hypothetical protein
MYFAALLSLFFAKNSFVAVPIQLIPLSSGIRADCEEAIVINAFGSAFELKVRTEQLQKSLTEFAMATVFAPMTCPYVRTSQLSRTPVPDFKP